MEEKPVEGEIMGLGLGQLARVLVKFIKAKSPVAAKTALATAEEVSAPEDRTPAVFQPEGFLPSQFYDALHRKHLLEGEKLLMFAVLEDAVDQYMKYLNSPTRKGQNRFREAEEWINRENRLALFSFDNVCEALDIDPVYMRRGLHRWKEAHLVRHESAAVM
jgi:hypothetical protein